MPTSRRSSRARPTLDPSGIVDAALKLAQRAAPGAMSFRGLGRELGADPTAVYRHFRDRNALVEACLDRLIGEAAGSVPIEAPWRERLRVVAHAYYEAVVAHPVIGAEAGHRTTGGPGELAMLELLLAALVEAGLSRHDAVRYYPLLAGYVASMASADAAYRLQDDRVPSSTDRIWVGTQGLLDPDRFPTAYALREELAALRTDEVFHTGLELLLDAVELSAARAAEG